MTAADEGNLSGSRQDILYFSSNQIKDMRQLTVLEMTLSPRSHLMSKTENGLRVPGSCYHVVITVVNDDENKKLLPSIVHRGEHLLVTGDI